IASNHGDVMHWFPKHGKSMDTFRAAVKELLAKETPTQQEQEKPAQVTTGEITVGTVVQFKDSAETYNPTTKAIPNWVKKDYNHIVTQTTSNGKSVIKGGKTCVLLGKKIKKSGGEAVAGVNTWTAVDNLTIVSGGSTTTETKQQRTYTVKSGDTLWGIAKKELGSGARYTEIVQVNGLKTTTIYSGQKLKLPGK
ncbi:MAG: LysM peptidoglycan-binding domain-containing protein, partial [Oscillospiraceae bacterium]|nr:LysM peptidoglycan-binding domain-containing protein [Oscillospiraceae bacterium]